LDAITAAIAEADAATVATIAARAITRIGEIGLEAGEAFGAEVETIVGENDQAYFEEGCSQIDTHLF